MKTYWSRREFLEFMGVTSSLAVTSGILSSCSHLGKNQAELDKLKFIPLKPSTKDELGLASNFQWRKLISWDDTINSKGDRFGFNNDYINWVPVPGKQTTDEIILWVNHESVDPIIMGTWKKDVPRTKADIQKEKQAVGGSILHLKKQNGVWAIDTNSKYNRRISGETKIPFFAPRKIFGSKIAVGTLTNCAGGKTPDNKILTCEENYDQCYGEISYDITGERIWHRGEPDYGWHEFFKNPPEHYGWVVEVDPLTGKSRKLTQLGRFAHECATTVVAKDGRWVVYMGDDANDQCVYKFISSSPGQLDRGTLYVADTINGKWLPLELNQNEKLKSRFKDQIDLLIQTRIAADLIGGTKLDRPEDIEVHPTTREVFVSLSNNKPQKRPHGSVLKIKEENSDHAALTFKAETFMLGGQENAFSCPDNLAFDAKGDLWLTTDISVASLNKKEYKNFGNNGLFYIPMSGPNLGFVFQIASAPIGAELTGPCFSPDGKSLFLSVQHPGEGTEDLKHLVSHWPDGGNSIPKPSVVEITGPLFGG